MKTYTIVTNNALLFDCSDHQFRIERAGNELAAVYEKVSEMLQNGFRLISSPLPANVPLIRSPIRSIILQKVDKKYDTHGLIALEKAKERTETLGVNTDLSVLEDLRTIDRDQLSKAKKQLNMLNKEPFEG